MYFSKSHDWEANPDRTVRQQLIEIIGLFYTLARSDPDLLSHDRILIKEWIYFNTFLDDSVRALYMFVLTGFCEFPRL